MFDINSLEIADTAEYHVTNAAGELQYADPEQTIPVTITIFGPGTKKGMKAQHSRDEKRNAAVYSVMGGRQSKRDETNDLEDRAVFLAGITAAFNNFTIHGKAGYEAYKSVYMNPKLGHIADGVERTYNDRGNFKPASLETASSTSGTQLG